MFAVVLFAAYSDYDAAKTINERKLKKFQMKNHQAESKDDVFMKRALELSELAIKDHGDPFGAVVVKDGKIIGEGWNKTKLLTDPSAHAEVDAIKNACKNLNVTDLSDCTIYASAEPCPMCLSLIYLTNIKKVYYCIPHDRITSFNKDLSVAHIYKELEASSLQRNIPEVQILSDEVDKYLNSYRCY